MQSRAEINEIIKFKIRKKIEQYREDFPGRDSPYYYDVGQAQPDVQGSQRELLAYIQKCFDGCRAEGVIGFMRALKLEHRKSKNPLPSTGPYRGGDIWDWFLMEELDKELKYREELLALEETLPDSDNSGIVHDVQMVELARRAHALNDRGTDFGNLQKYVKELVQFIKQRINVCYELHPDMNGATIAKVLGTDPNVIYRNSAYKRKSKRKKASGK